MHHLTVAWDIEGEDYVLDLKLNRDLIPDNYFQKYHHEVNQLSLMIGRVVQVLSGFCTNFSVNEIKLCE